MCFEDDGNKAFSFASDVQRVNEHTAGQSRAGIWFNPPTAFCRHQLWTKGSGRYIMIRTDFGGSQFPGDDSTDGRRSFSLIAIQTPDAPSSPRIFYWRFKLREFGITKCL